MDYTALELSTLAPEMLAETYEFVKRELKPIPDLQMQQYSQGQVSFTTQSISTGSAFTDFKNSSLYLPIVSQLTAAGNNFTWNANAAQMTENAWACSFKNGAHHLIHQMTVSLGNGEIIGSMGFQNLNANFDLITSMSTEDELNYGSSILYAKDTAESQTYDTVMGSCNNVIKDSLFSPSTGFGSLNTNKGRQSRMKWTSQNSSDVACRATLPTTTGGADKISQNEVTYKSYCKQLTTTKIGYVTTAIVPLRILNDFFRKLPLIRNANFILTFYVNMPSSNVLTYTASALASQAPSVPLGGTFPLMISPIAFGTSTGSGLFISGTATAGTITMTCNIGKSPDGTLVHPFPSAQLLLSQVEMVAAVENQYIARPQKTIQFWDFCTPTPALEIGPGQSVNQLQLHTNLSCLRRLIIQPMISALKNGTSPCSPHQSAICSEPATCSPNCSISNYQVAIGSKNLYDTPKTWSYEMFQTELRPVNCKNGGIVVGDSSGLISEHDFRSGAYGWVVSDLSRKDPSQDKAPKNVVVSFTNNSEFTMSYHFILQYERVEILDIQLGQRVGIQG